MNECIFPRCAAWKQKQWTAVTSPGQALDPWNWNLNVIHWSRNFRSFPHDGTLKYTFTYNSIPNHVGNNIHIVFSYSFPF